MTNTKFRKRALLSSVAMLLVALVALGSATFAWFTSATTANAKGLVMKTTTSSGLVVKSETASALGYGKTTYLRYDANETNKTVAEPFVLNPASYTQNCKQAAGGESAVLVPALAKTTSDDPNVSVSGDLAVEGATAGTEYYAEKVYIKTTAGSYKVNLTGVTITPVTGLTGVNANIRDAIKVLVVDSSGKTLYHSGLTDEVNYYLTSQSASKRSDAVSGSKYTRVNTTPAEIGETITTAEDTYYVTVVVYLDGEDDSVFTTGVTADTLINSIELNFALGSEVTN